MNSSISSGPLTTNTLLFNGATYLKSVLVGVGTKIIIYDNTSATGKIIFEYDASAVTSAVFIDFSHMVQSKNGMFVAISGGPAIVYFG